MRGRGSRNRASRNQSSSAYSTSNEDYASTIDCGTSQRSQPSWEPGASTASTALGSRSSTSYSAHKTPFLKSPICRFCGERGHLARNCLNNAATTAVLAGTTNVNKQDLPAADAVDNTRPCSSSAPIGNLIDFTSTSDTETEENNPNTPEAKDANGPRRAKQWSELDQNSIREKVKSEEAFQAPLTEENLIDGSLDEEGARQAADAMIPVQLQRKRKGKKGKKNWYSLTPFVNT